MGLVELPHRHGGGERTAQLQVRLDQVERFQRVADVFRQLDDTTRIRIFWLLCHCEECVVNISAMLGMSSPAVSHHLRSLRSSGLIVSRRDGKEVYYRASDTPESQLLHQMIEQVMEITCPEQSDTMQAIHDWLLHHMDQRITIEELSRQYMMNPTTLKEGFKAVYGESLAAHIKAHRMEQAARMLRETDKSVAEIAQDVGYDSPSKFSAAFKATFRVLPREYRKNHPQ